MGKPSGLRERASDSPRSRPPSRRWTATWRRVTLRAVASGALGVNAVPGWVAVDVSSGSLIGNHPRGWIWSMLASEARSFSLLTKSSTGSAPTSLGWAAAVDHPPRSRHSLGHALDLGRTRRERCCALVTAGLSQDDADGDRHKPGLELGAAAILVLDP